MRVPLTEIDLRSARVAKKSKPTTPEDTAAAGEAAEPFGKGKPTPSRREAQAAKAQPLVGRKDKAHRQAQRTQMNEARNRARIGMMQGDERYLGARDKGAQRRYVRDYVDARFSLGEFLIPAMVLFLVLTFIPGIQVFSVLIVWAFVLLAVVDAIVLGILLKRKLAQKFGAANVQSGFRWYAAMRAFQFRMLRMPKPQVKRFNFPS